MIGISCFLKFSVLFQNGVVCLKSAGSDYGDGYVEFYFFSIYALLLVEAHIIIAN